MALAAAAAESAPSNRPGAGGGRQAVGRACEGWNGVGGKEKKKIAIARESEGAREPGEEKKETKKGWRNRGATVGGGGGG